MGENSTTLGDQVGSPRVVPSPFPRDPFPRDPFSRNRFSSRSLEASCHQGWETRIRTRPNLHVRVVIPVRDPVIYMRNHAITRNFYICNVKLRLGRSNYQKYGICILAPH